MNLPIIFRCTAGIFRFGGHCNWRESSDNLLARCCNLPMNNRPPNPRNRPINKTDGVRPDQRALRLTVLLRPRGHALRARSS
jgi:hypothetical protein